MKEYKGTELHKFNQIYKEMDEIYHEITLWIGISHSAFEVLYTICILGEGCLQKDVCREAFLCKQTVNSSVRRLEKEGWLYLEESGGRDKRIWLTEKGRCLVEQKVKQIPDVENESFLEMSAEEREELIRLSRKYLDIFRRREKKLLEEMT